MMSVTYMLDKYYNIHLKKHTYIIYILLKSLFEK